MKTRLSIFLIATLLMTEAFAGEWDFTGFAALESRAFWLDGRHSRQEDDYVYSLTLQPELYWASDDGRQRISLVGFARSDSQDSKRSHADLRQAYWGYEADGWDVIAGVNKIFWGVAESRNLVDVINQTDLVEDIGQKTKLGQPMINLNLQRDFGRFEFYALPWFRERTFPGAEGRFRTALTVDGNHPIYESGADQTHLDLAARYSHYFGDVDIGAHFFEGTSREPVFVVAADGDRLLPVYEQMTQVGVDLQYTRNAWLWKLEALGRSAHSDSFIAAVGGFEYTFFGVRDSAADLGLLVEYNYDARDSNAPPTALDKDLFVGARIALNDTSDTSILAGVVADIDTGELFLSVKAERRFGDNLSVKARLRAFAGSDPGEALYALERDDHLQLTISWYY